MRWKTRLKIKKSNKIERNNNKKKNIIDKNILLKIIK